MESFRWTNMHYFSVLFFIALTFFGQSEARPWNKDIPTATIASPDLLNTRLIVAHPTPFDIAQEEVFKKLGKRDAHPLTVCGFINGVGTIVALCSTESVCIWDTSHAVVGCTDTVSGSRDIYTTCYDKNNRDERVDSDWAYTCPGNEECFRNTYEPVNGQNFYQWGCGKSTNAGTVLYSPLGVTETKSIYIWTTGIDIPESTPTTTPEPEPEPEPTTVTQEPETVTREVTRTSEPEPEPTEDEDENEDEGGSNEDQTTTEPPEPEPTEDEEPSPTSDDSAAETTSSEDNQEVGQFTGTPTSQTTADDQPQQTSEGSGDSTTSATAVPTNDEKSTPIGAIVGGAVGGFLFLAFIILAIVLIRRRRRRDPEQMPPIGGPPPDSKPPNQSHPIGMAQPYSAYRGVAPVPAWKQPQNAGYEGPREIDGTPVASPSPGAQRWSELSGETISQNQRASHGHMAEVAELPTNYEYRR